MLAAVGQGPELGKPEEATVALDRVDGAKNARQPLRVAGGLFERKEIPVELIEVFTRLDEKFLDEFTVVVHSSPPAYPAKAAQGGKSVGEEKEGPQANRLPPAELSGQLRRGQRRNVGQWIGPVGGVDRDRQPAVARGEFR